MMKPLDELTELEVLEWWAIQGQNIFLGVELETVLREQGYLMGALGITESGLWRLEVLRHEQTKAQLDAWQALGRELVDWFKPRYSAETGDLGLMLLGYFPEQHPLYIAFKRLLELTSE